MNTEVLKADTESINKAAKLLQSSEVVGIPTETVYGLAANAFSDKAVKKIFEAKGRPQDNPLIVHIADLSELEDITAEVKDDCIKLAQAFWPGPLTIVMPKSEKIGMAVSGGLDTVAIRMPQHPIARKIISSAGIPLAAPSANLSGSPSPTTAQHVLNDMNGRIPLIIDGGFCSVGVESTVITICDDKPVLLRPGYITKQQLENALDKEVCLSSAILDKLKDGEKANSPGMKYKHYAPKADITIIGGSFEKFKKYAERDKNSVALCFDEDRERLCIKCVCYGAEKDHAQQAQRLFSALRELDEIGAQTVYARKPQKDGVALAVYNRLLRAAAFKVMDL